MADSRPTLYIVGAGEMPPDLGSSLSRDFDLRLVREASEVPAGARAIEIRSGDALTSDRADRLLNAIGEGVVLASPDGEITWANNLFRNFEDELHQRVADLGYGDQGKEDTLRIYEAFTRMADTRKGVLDEDIVQLLEDLGYRKAGEPVGVR